MRTANPSHFISPKPNSIRSKFPFPLLCLNVTMLCDLYRQNSTICTPKAYTNVCFLFLRSYITLWTYLLTYSMVQSPSWEANPFAASQEIPRISRNPKVHYRTHKRPPPVSILGQTNPVHIPTSHLLEIHPNIIHPFTPRSPQWFPSLRFPHQDPIHPLSSPTRPTLPVHLILLDFITRTILGEEYKSFSSSLCNLEFIYIYIYIWIIKFYYQTFAHQFTVQTSWRYTELVRS